MAPSLWSRSLSSSVDKLSGSELTLRSAEKTDADRGVGGRVLSEMLLLSALASRPIVTRSIVRGLTDENH